MHIHICIYIYISIYIYIYNRAASSRAGRARGHSPRWHGTNLHPLIIPPNKQRKQQQTLGNKHNPTINLDAGSISPS